MLLSMTSDLSLTSNLPECWGRGKRISLQEEIKIKEFPAYRPQGVTRSHDSCFCNLFAVSVQTVKVYGNFSFCWKYSYMHSSMRLNCRNVCKHIAVKVLLARYVTEQRLKLHSSPGDFIQVYLSSATSTQHCSLMDPS